jgi:hypothetical protein
MLGLIACFIADNIQLLLVVLVLLILLAFLAIRLLKPKKRTDSTN